MSDLKIVGGKRTPMVSGNLKHSRFGDDDAMINT